MTARPPDLPHPKYHSLKTHVDVAGDQPSAGDVWQFDGSRGLWVPVTVASLGMSISHDDLTGVSADDHHAQQHAIDGPDHTGTLDHSEIANVGADDHHTRYADSEADARADARIALADLADLATQPHSALTGVTADQHHAEAHTIASHSDTSATGSNLNTLVGGGATTLHKHDHGGQDGLNDDDHPFYAKGVVTAASRTSDFTSLGAGPTTIVSCASFTFVSARWYKITAYVSDLQRTAGLGAADRSSINITDNTTFIQRGFRSWEGSSEQFSGSLCVVLVTNSLSGSKVIRMRYLRVNGSHTVSLRAASSEPAVIFVEDLGN